jgi:zinc/manganese transport system permease protein
LGTTMAFLLGYELDSDIAYLFSLGFALFGAAVFAFTRGIKGKIPQEAIIGIAYAVSSAAAIMAVSHAPEGAEHIKYLLVGSVLTVTPGIVVKTAVVYALIGLFHIVFFKKFSALTFSHANPPRHAGLWEFLFYASFGVTVTSSVKICGVLLVFIFLVVPSVFAVLSATGVSRHLALGWLFGLVGSALGMWLSFQLDTPPGATIVCVFGAMLLLFASLRKFRPVRRAEAQLATPTSSDEGEISGVAGNN